MTLKQQIVTFLVNLLLVLLIGTYTLSLVNTKNFLEEELVNHAQDTATSLGLSLSTVADPSDQATMETMINAIFDRGYYLKIVLKDQQGQVLYQRENPNKVEGVPAWFVKFISIHSPPAQAVIQAGWIPIGTLEVTSHPGYAYLKLWRESLSLLAWFVLIGLVAIGITLYGVKVLLQPLLDLEKQAKAIVRKEYIVQEELPKTEELRRVVTAMNSMVEKIKEIFERDAQQIERLQRQAYLDPVTEFSNRTHFEMRFSVWLDPDEPTSHGTAWMLRLESLQVLNEHYGWIIGDQVIQQLASTLKEVFEDSGMHGGLYARLNGSEFMVLLPNATPDNVLKASEVFRQKFEAKLVALKVDPEEVHYVIGLTAYYPGQKRPELMALLDQALEQAKAQADQPIYLLESGQDEERLVEQWTLRLEQAIQGHRFKLYQQTAYDLDHNEFSAEVFIRLVETDGSVKSAGYFMPMAQKTGLMAQIDQEVLTQVLAAIQNHPPKRFYAINIGWQYIQTPELLADFISALQQLPQGDCFVAFEISEAFAHQNLEVVTNFIRYIKAHSNIKVGFDHVGADFKDQYYLIDLMPDYVKLDGAFAQSILSDEKTQNYIEALADLVSRLDIVCVAMSVESEEQAYIFSGYGITYCQGYVFGAPVPLNE